MFPRGSFYHQLPTSSRVLQQVFWLSDHLDPVAFPSG
jgi:hypothetical protein